MSDTPINRAFTGWVMWHARQGEDHLIRLWIRWHERRHTE